MELWFDASDASTISIDTGVRSWADKSGNARHALQTATNSQPAWTQGALANKPVLTFDGLNDSLYLPVLDLSAWTIFIVCNRTAGVTNASLLQLAKASFSTETALVALNNDATNGPLLVGSGSTGSAKYGKGGSLSAGTSRVITARWAGAGTDGATYYSAWDNGTTVTLADSGSIPQYSGTGSRIGASWSSGSLQSFFRGQIAEIIVYSSALSTDQRSAVETALMRKWGL
jgi:hypothetical protein